MNGSFMAFASVSDPGCFFGVAPTGETRAVRDGGTGDLSQFHVLQDVSDAY